MNTEFLRTFLSVVQTKNFTHTAQISHLSQSTVSNRIMELEKIFDCQLFIRGNGTLELTESGKQLIAYAEEMLTVETTAQLLLNQVKMKEPYFMVSAVHAYYDSYLQSIISESIHQRLPYTLRLFLKHSHEVIQGVVTGKYDCGIAHHPSYYSRFDSILLCTDELVLVGADRERKYEDGISFGQLKSLDIFHSSLFASHVEDLLYQQNTYRLSIDIASRVVPLVIQHGAYTFLPFTYARPLVEKGELYPITIEDYELPPLEYYFVYPKDHPYLDRIETLKNKLLSFV